MAGLSSVHYALMPMIRMPAMCASDGRWSEYSDRLGLASRYYRDLSSW